MDILHNEGDVPDGPEAIRFSPDGSPAIVGTRGRHTFIYDLPSNELAHKLAAGPILSMAHDQRTGRLYTSGDEPGINVWDLEGFGVAQHLDLAAVSDGRAVTIIDTSSDGSWTEIASITTDDRVRGLAFNPDGSKLAIGDASALSVVDTATWQVGQQIKLPSVSGIHWIDDETVLVGTATGLFGTVSLSTDRLLNDIRAGLLRSFTDQECSTYRIDPCLTLDEMKDG